MLCSSWMRTFVNHGQDALTAQSGQRDNHIDEQKRPQRQ
eukprot:COSAG06_NODE_12416_length_1384_cov_961.639689_2_plen_38_part_01